MQHEKANGPHVSLSEQHGRKTPGRAVSAHLWEIRETPFTRQSHTKGLYTVQHNSSMRYPLDRQFRKWEDNIAFISFYTLKKRPEEPSKCYTEALLRVMANC